MDKISSKEPISPQYECDYCQMKFRSKRVMSRHILSHTNAEPIYCDDCGGEFPNLAALEQHSGKHERKNKYKCKYCLESFRRHWKFTKHLETHDGPHPYECRICLDSFKTEKYFQVHLKTHKRLEPKSFVCNNCKKKFTHLALLNRHLLTHSSIKPYPCVLCDKTFPDVATRSRHVKNHAPLCLLCDKRPFKNFAALRHHIEQMHRKKTQIKIAGNKQAENEMHKIEHVLQKEDENVPDGNIVVRKSPDYSRIKNLFETPKQEINVPVKKFFDVRENIIKNTSSDALFQNVSESGEEDEKSVTRQILKVAVNNNTDVKPELPDFPFDVKPEVQKLPLDVKQNVPLDVSNQCQTVFSMFQNPWIGNQNQLMLQNLTIASVIPSSMPFSSEYFINWLKEFTNQCRLLKYPVEGFLLTKINQVHKIILDLLASSSGVFSQKENFQILMEINEILEKVISGNMKYKLKMLAVS
ncbi:zinc finger protein 20-like [Stegodyphus dumicola]|uniref:zinc finger protein 20-like n=1 Tax=Stegodyphus dumicola TaxID=202533 RepID=UPI0015B286BD|nr:zinc finger protein 20-like [Stegodyphus dumicola]XP_035213610.1 zinc finger protein 20-like [Stegodyphus dumicola]